MVVVEACLVAGGGGWVFSACLVAGGGGWLRSSLPGVVSNSSSIVIAIVFLERGIHRVLAVGMGTLRGGSMARCWQEGIHALAFRVRGGCK